MDIVTEAIFAVSVDTKLGVMRPRQVIAVSAVRNSFRIFDIKGNQLYPTIGRLNELSTDWLLLAGCWQILGLALKQKAKP